MKVRRRTCARVIVALAAAVVIPACGSSGGSPGAAGPAGPAGPGVNPVLAWTDPVNISNQVVTNADSAHSQQAVFTPDGRLHVVYAAYDSDSGDYQLWYSSSAAPYTTWDAPVLISGDGVAQTRYPYEFDLAAGSDNSARVAYVENASSGFVGISAIDSATGVFTLDNPRPASLVVGLTVNVFSTSNGNDGSFLVTAVGSSSITLTGAFTDEVASGGGLNYGSTRVIHTRNTSAARLTFAESVVSTHFDSTGMIASPRLVGRGSASHVVWTQFIGVNGTSFFHSHNGSGAFLVAPNLLDDISNSFTSDELVLLNDAAGNTHLVHYHNDGGGSEERIAYRGMPAAAGNSGSFGAAQIANDDNSENDIRTNLFPPFMKLDGSNNVYVFWKQYESGFGGGTTYLYGNIKTATGTFTRNNAAKVTDDPNDDGISAFLFLKICDVEVAADGTIHAAWHVNSSYGRNDLYPIWYRTKSPGLNAQSGWSAAEVAAWTYNSGDMQSNGAQRSVLVKSAEDGAVHLLYADEDNSTDIYHAYKAAGSSVWRSGGNATRPSTLAFYPSDGIAYNYLVDAGVNPDGTPWVLFVVDPDSTLNSNLVYTQWSPIGWLTGADINGTEDVRFWGDFWSGVDADGKLHALWQERVDPFDNQWNSDLMHGMQP